MPNSNYWVDYDGSRYETTYHHAQRLMKVQTDVIAGTRPPTAVEIQVAGDGDAPMLTVQVDHMHRLDITPLEVFRRDQM